MFDKEIVDDSWCDFVFCLPLVLDCGFSRESRQSQKATRFGIDKIRAEAAASFQRITPQMIDDVGEPEIRKDLPSPWATCPNLQSDSFRWNMDPSLCRLATQSSCSRCDKTSLLLRVTREIRLDEFISFCSVRAVLGQKGVVGQAGRLLMSGL